MNARAAEAYPPRAETPALPAGWDWQRPDYRIIFAQRLERLKRIRSTPSAVSALRTHYRLHPELFISDHGITSDPRNALLGQPVLVPFVLFPRQQECAAWILERARRKEPGLIEKSRDCGMSWLAIALACTLCLFNRDLVIGFGSNKADKLDRSDDPDCLFWKLRTFLRHLPPEFRGTWDAAKHSAHMRVAFPDTNSVVIGEAGDNIGRGGRSSIFFIDEAAHLERPALIEASLASNTDCRIDISSVAGLANAFAQKRHSGRVPVFTFHWRDDPRKDERWYERQKQTLDPVTLAAEVDLDYKASVEGQLIPAAWVQSAVGALSKLGLTASGIRRGALDVADEGVDRNAFVGRHGQRLEYLSSWSGANKDIFDTVQRAFAACDEMQYASFHYDADGMGAGVRGDAKQINLQRQSRNQRWITDEPYRGSAAPEPGEMVPGRRNEDFFANLKAQAWWALRLRFQETHRAVEERAPYNADLLISLDPTLPELPPLLQELTQPTYSLNAAGKLVIDKAPAGCASPNLADAVCMAFNPLSTEGGFFATACSNTAPVTPSAEPVPLPQRCEAVFAAGAAALGADHDAIATVYFAVSVFNPAYPPLVVLDWELQRIEGAMLDAWLPTVEQRLAAFATETKARGGSGGLSIEAEALGSTIWEAGNTRFSIDLTPEELTQIPLTERAVAASNFVRSGKVRFTQAALDRRSDFKGTARNHLAAQLAAFGTSGADPLANGGELLAAFCDGVLLAMQSRHMRPRLESAA